jgi:hypothetical protein
MARSWFDKEKLLPDERLVREGPARLRADGPPYWWEGELILTTDRLLFLPHMHNAQIRDGSFWLNDVVECEKHGRDRIRIIGTNSYATFRLTGMPAIPGLRWKSWTRDIARLTPQARPRRVFDEFLQTALVDVPSVESINEEIKQRRAAG